MGARGRPHAGSRQLLLTTADIQDRERYVNAKNALEASLKLGALPVINENDSVATSEIKFGDNDSLSAWDRAPRRGRRPRNSDRS